MKQTRSLAFPLLFLGLLSSCQSEVGPTAVQGEGGSDSGAAQELSSTRLMAARLAEVAREARENSPYFEDRTLRSLESQLAHLGDDPDPLDILRLNEQIASHRLRLGGRTERAIEAWTDAHAQLAELDHLLPPKRSVTLTLSLAFGHLRLAETRNCVARHTAESCLLPIRGSGVHIDQGPSRKAIELLEQALAKAPSSMLTERLRARWLLNIAYMTIGGYPDDVPDEYVVPLETFDSEQEFTRFRDIAPDLGINAFNLAGGAILEDFDGDGLLDILTTTMELDGQMRYFHNDGDGTFSDRTKTAGLTGLTGGLNCVQADYDNDGDVDVLVLRGAWLQLYGLHPNSLLRNAGDGTFVDVTEEAGLLTASHPTQSAAWADFDLDGDLDLFVGNEFNGGQESSCQLFRNEGHGSFTDVAAQAGVENDDLAKSATWGDVNGDRYPDLYVSNMFGDNRLYLNQKDGTFRDVAHDLGVEGPSASFPSWFWDYDNDGVLDLFVAGYVSETAAVFADIIGIEAKVETMRLYRGDGAGGFRDVTQDVRLERVTSTMGASYGDIDGDGYLDIYLGTGTPKLDALMPNLLLRNHRGEVFRDVTTAAGVGHLQKGHGISIGDIDNDGDNDIYAQLGGLYPVDAFGNALFLNPGFGHHWLTIDLVGTKSNRSAIGTRVRLVVRDAAGERDIYSHVSSGGTFGANSLRQEIGLGDAEAIRSLEVYWPLTDETQVFTDVKLDQFVRVVEGRDELEILDWPRVAFKVPTD